MGCCGKEEVNPDEDDFEGPLKHRSCTDIICLIIFLAYIIGMMYMLAFAIMTGNPYRIIYGYDVAGDICGSKNDPISGVAQSGKDLSYSQYLYFDIPRAVQIVGGNALVSANQSIQTSLLKDMSNSTNSVSFCLYGSTTPTTAALLDDTTSEAVIQLHEQLRSAGAYIVRTERGRFSTMTVALSNGVMSVYNTKTDEEENDDQLTVSDTRLDSRVGFYRRKRNSDQNLTQMVLASDPITQITTGGGTCRYCVKECPSNYTVFFWRCMPSFASSTFTTLFSGTGIESIVDGIVKDIQASWREIIYMCLVALGSSLIMIVLLRFLAGVIVYIILIVIALACIIGPLILWLLWYTKKSNFDAQTASRSSNNSTNSLTTNVTQITNNLLGTNATTAVTKSDVDNYLMMAIIGTIIAVIVLLILLVLRKRIKLVVQLFYEAGKAVQNMPLLLLQPVWTFLTIVTIIASWTIGLLWIESAGFPQQSSQTGFVTYVKNELLALMILFHMFGLLWLLQFAVACQHMAIAGAVATWYFTRDKATLHLPVVVSIWRVFRYHLGTVAFGSFIIALVQLIRIIVKYIEKKAKEHGVANGVTACIFKCIDCCLWCFEKCLKFINRNAYIEVAIYGVNFCSGARKAFTTLSNNVLRVAALNSVGTFVLFLGKLVVVIATVLCGIQIMNARSSTDQPIKNEWAPILLAAIFAYVTSHCFISVYGMAVDTIFICFCEDSDKNDGLKKPYYMSIGLMEYVENSAKALEALKERQATGGSTAKVIKVAEAEED